MEKYFVRGDKVILNGIFRAKVTDDMNLGDNCVNVVEREHFNTSDECVFKYIITTDVVEYDFAM